MDLINQSNQSLPVGVRSDQSEEKLLYRNSWHDRVWTLDIDNGSWWSKKHKWNLEIYTYLII